VPLGSLAELSRNIFVAERSLTVLLEQEHETNVLFKKPNFQLMILTTINTGCDWTTINVTVGHSKRLQLNSQ